jgi:hypothetical protein
MTIVLPFRRREETSAVVSATVPIPTPTPSSQRVRLFDGKVVLYKRPDYKNDYWQYSIPVGDKFEKKSTKTSDLEKAKKIVSDRYREVVWFEERGMSAAPTSFEAAAKGWVEAQQRMIALGGKHVQLKQWIIITQRHLIPFFGKKLVSKIDQKEVNAYHDAYLAAWQRLDFTKLHPKKPSAISMSNHEHLIMRICQHALTNKMISEREMPKFQFTKKPESKRAGFSREEWVRLMARLESRIQETPHNDHKQARRLLLLYVRFLEVVSARPGVEALLLRFGDVERKTPINGEDYATVCIRDGKNGSRKVVCKREVLDIVNEIKALYVNPQPTDPIFGVQPDKALKYSRFQVGFNMVLKELGLERDALGLPRSMYSIRHYSITQKILNGQNLEQIPFIAAHSRTR